jgi:hypothetical protein
MLPYRRRPPARQEPGRGADAAEPPLAGRVAVVAGGAGAVGASVVELSAGRRVPPPDGVVRLLDRSGL